MGEAISSARIIMIGSLLLGAVIVVSAFVWPIAIAHVALDAVLIPEELNTPELNRVALKVLKHDAQRRGALLYALLGSVVCGLNLVGLMLLKHHELAARRSQ